MDITALFGSFPSDRAEAWERLAVVLSAWFDPMDERAGVSDEEILKAERRLGLQLPTAMREAYHLFGAREEISEGFSMLLPPRRLAIRDRSLVFWEDKDKAAAWGIRSELLQIEDPPVSADLTNLPDHPVAELWCDTGERFTQFFVDMSLFGVLEASRFQNWGTVDRGKTPEGMRHLTRLDFPDNRYLAPGTRLYGGDDLLVSIDETGNVVLGAQTSEAYHRAKAWLDSVAWTDPTDEDADRGDFREAREDRVFVETLLVMAGARQRALKKLRS